MSLENKEKKLIEKLVQIRRVAKVVKGGRRFSFSALVVVGDGQGKLGVGIGKASEVSEAVKKAGEKAKKRMRKFVLYNRTIHHPLYIKQGSSKLMIKPGPPGSGIISSGPVRAVMEAVGVKDINVKAIGSTTPSNLVLASIKGLSQFKSFEAVAEARGRSLDQVKLISF